MSWQEARALVVLALDCCCIVWTCGLKATDALKDRIAALRAAVQVLWNKQRGAARLSSLLYGPPEEGGLGLIPAVDTPKGE